jgi:LacI family transcriptional regulator
MPARPDAQPLTIRDIARQAGVSASTVSRVLNDTVPVTDAKRRAVRNVIESLGYRPNLVAQELARGRSQAIGVLPQGIANPFYGQVLKGVEQGLRRSDYHPLFASGEEEEAEALDQLLSHRVDALIVIGGHLPEAELARLSQRIPLVAIGRRIAGLEHRCLRVENREGAQEATRHLLEQGHRRIAHITGVPGHPDAIARREGYQEALASAGLPLDPGLIVEGDFEERTGLEATEKLVAAGIPFTAIFAGNDRMAYGAGLTLLRRGLQVPRDVSLIGFDDQPSAAYAWPPLTTMRQPAVEMGVAAARALLDELQGRGWALPSFRTELVRRESTAPPAAPRPEDAGPGH